MTINGIDRHFAFTVKAYKAISRLCRLEDIGNISELFEGSSLSSNENLQKIAIIMNDAYISKVKMLGIEVTEPLLTEEELDNMSIQDLTELSLEINTAMTMQGEIELADSKKNAKVTE